MTDPQLEGMTVAERLSRGPLEPKKALDIVEQLLAGLEASHALGLVHAGISPEKIILSPDGKATLVGFPGHDPGAQPMARFGKGAAEPGHVGPEVIGVDKCALREAGVAAFKRW